MNDFCNEVLNGMKRKMPTEHFDINTVVKPNNVKKIALSLSKEDGFCPHVYLDDFFYDYVEELMSLEEILDKIAFHLQQKQPEFSFDFISIDNLYIRLVNTEKSKTLLKMVPHKDFLDLSMVMSFVVKNFGNKLATTWVTYSFLDQLKKESGMTEEELFVYAMNNTELLFPAKIQTIESALKERAIEDKCPQMLADIMFSELEKPCMYILSNESSINGASAMITSDKIMELAKSTNENLYILPIDMHHLVLIIEGCGMTQKEIIEMQEMSSKAYTDWLSDQTYYYDRNTRSITLV